MYTKDMNIMKQNVSKGFTLIELMMVIAIVGILSSTVIAALRDANVVSRDSKRVSEAKQLQNAVELYRNANDQYPCTESTASSTCGAAAVTYFNDGTVSSAAAFRRDNLRTDLSPFIRAVDDVQLSGVASGATSTTYGHFGSIHYTPGSASNVQRYTITVYGEQSSLPVCTLTADNTDC